MNKDEVLSAITDMLTKEMDKLEICQEKDREGIIQYSAKIHTLREVLQIVNMLGVN